MTKALLARAQARQGVLGASIVFGLFGIVVLVLSTVGFQRIVSLNNEADVLSSLSLPRLVLVILLTSLFTIVVCAVGFVGAFHRSKRLLKIFLLLLIILMSIQLAISIYIFTLRVNVMRDAWNDETSSARNMRVAFQNYMDCCGYQVWTDSIGFLDTPCPLEPRTLNDAPPPSCYKATSDFLRRWIIPIAATAITVAVLEIAAVYFSVVIVFHGKRKEKRTGFEYY